jgi:hypothetical protein
MAVENENTKDIDNLDFLDEVEDELFEDDFVEDVLDGEDDASANYKGMAHQERSKRQAKESELMDANLRIAQLQERMASLNKPNQYTEDPTMDDFSNKLLEKVENTEKIQQQLLEAQRRQTDLEMKHEMDTLIDKAVAKNGIDPTDIGDKVRAMIYVNMAMIGKNDPNKQAPVVVDEAVSDLVDITKKLSNKDRQVKAKTAAGMTSSSSGKSAAIDRQFDVDSKSEIKSVFKTIYNSPFFIQEAERKGIKMTEMAKLVYENRQKQSKG